MFVYQRVGWGSYARLPKVWSWGNGSQGLQFGFSVFCGCCVVLLLFGQDSRHWSLLLSGKMNWLVDVGSWKKYPAFSTREPLNLGGAKQTAVSARRKNPHGSQQQPRNTRKSQQKTWAQLQNVMDMVRDDVKFITCSLWFRDFCTAHPEWRDSEWNIASTCFLLCHTLKSTEF